MFLKVQIISIERYILEMRPQFNCAQKQNNNVRDIYDIYFDLSFPPIPINLPPLYAY